MNVTTRDRKVLAAVVVLALLAGYWFLLLSPKRDEAAKLGDQLAEKQQQRDAAKGTVARLEAAKTSFAADYATVVRLGKAVPETVDMPGVLLQLERAAQASGIDFERISAGPRVAAPTPAAAPAAPAGEQAGTPAAATPPAQGGSQPAQSAPGQAAQGAQQTANAASAQAAQSSGVSPADTQTSTSAGNGTLPVGGGSSAPAPGASAGVTGLDSVPLQFSFSGSFFDLAGFFHDLKRFVRVANDRIVVRGRLLTIDSLKFSSSPELFPRLKAEVTGTIWLAPKAEGATAGATPQGPAPAAQPASGAAPATGAAPASGAPTPPTATVTP